MRRLFNTTTYFIPPEAAAQQLSVDMARAGNKSGSRVVPDEAAVDACAHKGREVFAESSGQHIVLARNFMGVGYYHTVYETLGSLAFLLPYLRGSGRHAAVLDNLCIPSVGGQNRGSMRTRTCQRGAVGFVSGLFELLGLNSSRLRHYPWLRQPDSVGGPVVHATRATFDCSPAPFRHYIHALKLREELSTRLLPLPARDAVVLVDRNSCDGGAFCKTVRNVRRQREIEAELRRRFDGQMLRGLELRVMVFTGKGPIREQAKLFRRAAVVVGPHGAGESNYIFCQPHTPVIEYINVLPQGGRPLNSALYVGYAHAFNLPYWAVVSNTSSATYDEIHPMDVSETVAAALQGVWARNGTARNGTSATAPDSAADSHDGEVPDGGWRRSGKNSSRWLDKLPAYLATRSRPHTTVADWDSFVVSGYDGRWPAGPWPGLW